MTFPSPGCFRAVCFLVGCAAAGRVNECLALAVPPSPFRETWVVSGNVLTVKKTVTQDGEFQAASAAYDRTSGLNKWPGAGVEGGPPRAKRAPGVRGIS